MPAAATHADGVDAAGVAGEPGGLGVGDEDDGLPLDRGPRRGDADDGRDSAGPVDGEAHVAPDPQAAAGARPASTTTSPGAAGARPARSA